MGLCHTIQYKYQPSSIHSRLRSLSDCIPILSLSVRRFLMVEGSSWIFIPRRILSLAFSVIGWVYSDRGRRVGSRGDHRVPEWVGTPWVLPYRIYNENCSRHSQVGPIGFPKRVTKVATSRRSITLEGLKMYFRRGWRPNWLMGGWPSPG